MFSMYYMKYCCKEKKYEFKLVLLLIKTDGHWCIVLLQTYEFLCEVDSYLEFDMLIGYGTELFVHCLSM